MTTIKKLVDGERTFMSVSIFETLIESLKDVPDGIHRLRDPKFTEKEIVLKIGDIEIPFKEVLDQCNLTAERSFDTAVAERAKEMVFSGRLDALRREVDDVCEKIGRATTDINYQVGRLIEDELGPGATWHESAGTC